ncbi:hypothetical protein B0H19DRAFT_934951, partial [Mycena capillaripes]
LDLLQTAFGTHEAWWFAIQNWGNASALQSGSWTTIISPITCGIISAMVQLFYASRIWILKRDIIPRMLAVLIAVLALAQSLAAIIGSSLLLETLSQEQLLHLHPAFSFWLAGSFVTDILIAGSMIWILHTSKSTAYISHTDSILNRLILNTVQTGTVTVVCAGIMLALFIKFTDRNYYYALYVFAFSKGCKHALTSTFSAHIYWENCVDLRILSHAH